MGNIRTIGLPIMLDILGNDPELDDDLLVGFIRSGIRKVTLLDGVTRTISASGEEVTPAPDETDSIWSVFVWQAMILYREHDLDAFSKEKDGIAVLSNAVMSVSRVETIRAKRALLEEAKSNYTQSVFSYYNGDSFTIGGIANRYEEPTT